MANYTYIGTVTFNSNLTFQKKKLLIDKFPDFISDYLCHTPNSHYLLKYSIEYHKVDNLDDYEAPHIHYILYSTNKLAKYRFEALLKAFRHYYGRSQLYISTTLKLAQWSNYIIKDVIKNNQILGYEHYFEKVLQQTENNVEDQLLIDEDF